VTVALRADTVCMDRPQASYICVVKRVLKNTSHNECTIKRTKKNYYYYSARCKCSTCCWLLLVVLLAFLIVIDTNANFLLWPSSYCTFSIRVLVCQVACVVLNNIYYRFFVKAKLRKKSFNYK
jgi:hypothetical protein